MTKRPKRRAPGLPADYKGSTPRQVAEALLRYRPGKEPRKLPHEAADAIIEELWRVKDRMAREAGYDVKALTAAISSASGREHARRGGPSGMRGAHEPVSSDDAGSDLRGPDIAPTV